MTLRKKAYLMASSITAIGFWNPKDIVIMSTFQVLTAYSMAYSVISIEELKKSELGIVEDISTRSTNVLAN
jgi:hypothetical protein